ncbi:N-acetyl-gamma-glutamyl-phosphate reductase [Tumebacillus permanentifrigoris]|uniref:N-acetyl-gamma-glutamyl-phosphate reductase n=1 Tax=Tumebacillus permanentifrigoris TaxID=378543 RepID=A0A316D5X2_9BACL|nr:N-acetyl-gamma-glutamyl-phosphate reductase [Tumebacillus permanentifrigoris]PWK09573.1 N-acetyl-gamma-glutamyl-phosphate reductase [Tumebacillus permanentifrigoris]
MQIAILGATGYTGLEVVRLLQHHEQAEVTYVSSDSQAGAHLADVYPHLRGVLAHTLEVADPVEIAKRADYALVALPSGVSTNVVPGLLAAGVRVIDLAGDHRLPSAVYAAWYQKTPPSSSVLASAIYGLPELYADQIADAKLIANPGCYPTATLLSLLPLVKHGLIDPQSLIIDAKSGLSGAGKALSAGTHFVEVHENFKAYKVGEHQHIPEIEQVLTDVNPSGEPVTISFTTHLVPMIRGILTTSYAKLTGSYSTEDLLAVYREFYRNAPFVRLHAAGHWPQTRDVTASNYCDIGLRVDPRTQRVTVIGAIDNLVKGAGGQAIQNLNLLAGLAQTTGLTTAPVYL